VVIIVERGFFDMRGVEDCLLEQEEEEKPAREVRKNRLNSRNGDEREIRVVRELKVVKEVKSAASRETITTSGLRVNRSAPTVIRIAAEPIVETVSLKQKTRLNQTLTGQFKPLHTSPSNETFFDIQKSNAHFQKSSKDKDVKETVVYTKKGFYDELSGEAKGRRRDENEKNMETFGEVGGEVQKGRGRRRR
jgi:hypothetical protein